MGLSTIPVQKDVRTLSNFFHVLKNLVKESKNFLTLAYSAIVNIYPRSRMIMKTKTRISKKNILTTTVKTTVAALVSAVMLETASAQAITNIFIDELIETQQVDSNPNNSIPTSSQVGPTSNILGGIQNGYRDLFVVGVTNTSTDPSNRSNLSVTNGEAFFSNDFGVTGTGIMRWDGVNSSPTINPQGLGGVNIMDDGLDRIVMGLSTDLPGLNVTFKIYDMNGNMSSIARTFSSAMPTKVDEDFLFSGFGGNADFTSVGAIKLLLNGPERIDVAINLIEISKPVGIPIPEPTSILGLLVIGATGAGSILKRKHNR